MGREMMILEDYLQINAQRYATKDAIVCGHRRVTYSELAHLVSARCQKLSGEYREGQIVTLRATQSIEFLITYFALHRLRCIPAPMEKDMPDSMFGHITQRLSSLTAPEGTADILYTTGTTGDPKGVMISHRTIIADAENLIEGQGYSRELAFVINGPLNHIGSLSKVYPVVMMGATLIITDGLKDINAFYDAFSYPAEAFATFLVPASIRILLQFSAERLASLADKIDFIETGAAPISHDDMLTLCRILPHSRLYNTYASTETGIISTYDFNDGRCIAGCLGKSMKHSKVIITEKGLLACQGPTLMTGYIGEPERTAEILRNDTLFTADIATIDQEGMVHLEGREGDVINVGGFKVAPTEVEQAAMAHPDIADCICIATPHPITGQALKLLFVGRDKASIEKRELARFLCTKLPPHMVPMQYERTDQIERTFNGKLDRKHYHNTL